MRRRANREETTPRTNTRTLPMNRRQFITMKLEATQPPRLGRQLTPWFKGQVLTSSPLYFYSPIRVKIPFPTFFFYRFSFYAIRPTIAHAFIHFRFRSWNRVPWFVPLDSTPRVFLHFSGCIPFTFQRALRSIRIPSIVPDSNPYSNPRLHPHNLEIQKRFCFAFHF